MKRHPHDGTPSAGKPTGKIFNVISIEPHNPVDGPGIGMIANLDNSQWAFVHNLYEIKAHIYNEVVKHYNQGRR